MTGTAALQLGDLDAWDAEEAVAVIYETAPSRHN